MGGGEWKQKRKSKELKIYLRGTEQKRKRTNGHGQQSIDVWGDGV